jgi:hypothetical protein
MGLLVCTGEEQIAEHVGIIEEDDINPMAPAKGLRVCAPYFGIF